MSGLLFLTANDFQNIEKENGNVLCTNIKGFSLILFYSTQCNYCKELIPIFKNLPGQVDGCNFGMINVNKNKHIIQMSNQTIVPITYVPYIILYIDGIPFMRYDGESNQDEILNFIIEVANKVKEKRQFSNKNNQEENNKLKEPEIPPYCIAKPLCGKNDRRCYLKYDSAYKK